MEQKAPSTHLPLSSGLDSWSSSTAPATVSLDYSMDKPNHDAVNYDPQKDLRVSGSDQRSTTSMATAAHSHVPYTSSVQHSYNPVEYGNYYYSYPQATNYSSVQQGANQYPGAAYQSHTSYQSSGSYIGPTSNTCYNAGGQQNVPGYESSSHYYLNSIQQRANHQHAVALYQPIPSFQNPGSYIGPRSNTCYSAGGQQNVPGYESSSHYYLNSIQQRANQHAVALYQPIPSFQNSSYIGPSSNTYYNAGDHQTMPGLGSNCYYYQNNTCNDGSMGNNGSQSYQNYSSFGNRTLQSSTSLPSCSLPYQQQYNQWPYYNNHSLPCGSSNPVTGNDTTDNIAVNTPSGYSYPSSQPPGNTSWRNSAASVVPPMQASNLNSCFIENLPEPLLAEIIKRVTRTSDLNSLSLVSKHVYTVEGEERGSIRVGCGLHPATKAMSSLCSRFPNLWKIEINYSGWSVSQGKQLDSQGLRVLSSHCPSLRDLTLSFCSSIDDSGLGYLAYCKKLMALRLNSVPAISSSGLLSLAIGCKNLSTFHLIECMNVRSMETVLALEEFERAGRLYETQPEKLEFSNTGVEWLEYLGKAGSLVELVVKDCKEISHYDLLKFGPGFMKLQKFEFDIKNDFYWLSGARDPSYNARYPHKYDDICCENMKDLTLAKIMTQQEIGLRFLLRKCKALEKLCLDYVIGLDESEMIALFQNCSNLTSISLRLMPLHCGVDYDFRTPLTDDSLKALSLCCPMLQVVELTFACCSTWYPSEIGFTQDGIVKLIQSCPIRALVLGAYIFYDEGMKGISSAQFLEKLELVDCKKITDAGISFITRAPSLTSLTLNKCKNVTNEAMAELARSQKLDFLTVKGCRGISEESVKGAAKSVYYSAKVEIPYVLRAM